MLFRSLSASMVPRGTHSSYCGYAQINIGASVRTVGYRDARRGIVEKRAFRPIWHIHDSPNPFKSFSPCGHTARPGRPFTSARSRTRFLRSTFGLQSRQQFAIRDGDTLVGMDRTQQTTVPAHDSYPANTNDGWWVFRGAYPT